MRTEHPLPGAAWLLHTAVVDKLPARWFSPAPPAPEARSARRGRLSIELVSHCWHYAHLLNYQLSSLVLYPPRDADITMTVFHAEEDADTRALLAFFGGITVPGLRWNWQSLPREQLMRRGIGRNLAARACQADWIWFTDCDVLFREGCLDALAECLQGRRDALLHPMQEQRTTLLPNHHPLLSHTRGELEIRDVDTRHFSAHKLPRATGPAQITHGDTARAVGYCATLKPFQAPAAHWCKSYEDRAFRWLLGTEGVGLDIPGMYRIRHARKGRYRNGSIFSGLRGNIRRLKSWAGERMSDKS